MTDKPSWLITYENSIGPVTESASFDNGNENSELQDRLKSANAADNSIPAWLVTFRNSGGSL